MSVVDVVVDVAFARHWVSRFAAAVEESCDHLTRLDAAIGDADHGINMRRGMREVVAATTAPGQVTPAAFLETVGTQLIRTVGGAGGPLYGTAFRSLARALPQLDRVAPPELGSGLAGALAGIQRLGAAEVGDKTMVDAFAPAVASLNACLGRDAPLPDALWEAAVAAEAGMKATIPLMARKGRASYLGARSEGHQDPGATSTALLFSALADAAR